MDKRSKTISSPDARSYIAKILRQYGCGPIQFVGTDNALYERHLLFDNVVALTAADPFERFQAFARSVRDVLSQRWLLTEDTYERENPKRVYYLSMEFLIGRSLANNVTNLLLEPLAKQAVERKKLDWLGLLEQEHEPETRAALDLIFSDHFSRNEPGIFAPLRHTLLTLGDYYMHLADLKTYLEADRRLSKLYSQSDAWAHKAILNVAGSGRFSSDRTIAEYAADIWKVKPCPVP